MLTQQNRKRKELGLWVFFLTEVLGCCEYVVDAYVAVAIQVVGSFVFGVSCFFAEM
jgi:hypothetical protein